MKILLLTTCAAALLTGCSSYRETVMEDAATTGGRADVYGESWLYDRAPGRYTSERRLREEPIYRPEPEAVEITKTQRAMAMRQRAARTQELYAMNEGQYYGSGIATASGSVSTSFPIDQQVGSLPPVAERMGVDRSPTATPVTGRVGFVVSPYAPGAGYIDVRGLQPGSTAKDPFTGKIFRVP